MAKKSISAVKMPLSLLGWAQVDPMRWETERRHIDWTKEFQNAATSAYNRSGAGLAGLTLKQFVIRVQKHFKYKHPLDIAPPSSESEEVSSSEIGNELQDRPEAAASAKGVGFMPYPVKAGSLLADLLPDNIANPLDWYSVIPGWTRIDDLTVPAASEGMSKANIAWKRHCNNNCAVTFERYVSEVRAQRKEFEIAMKDWEFEQSHIVPLALTNTEDHAVPLAVVAGQTVDDAVPATECVDPPEVERTQHPVTPGALFGRLLPAVIPEDWASVIPAWSTLRDISQLDKPANSAEKAAAWTDWQKWRKDIAFTEYFRSVVSQRKLWEEQMLAWESGEKIELDFQKAKDVLKKIGGSYNFEITINGIVKVETFNFGKISTGISGKKRKDAIDNMTSALRALAGMTNKGQAIVNLITGKPSEANADVKSSLPIKKSLEEVAITSVKDASMPFLTTSDVRAMVTIVTANSHMGFFLEFRVS